MKTPKPKINPNSMLKKLQSIELSFGERGVSDAGGGITCIPSSPHLLVSGGPHNP
jgi:hypothetical protein